MTFQETKAYLLDKGPTIGRLAKLGDKLAMRVIQAHWDWHKNKFDPWYQSELIKITHDYCVRSLTIATRTILQDRFGVHAPREFKIIH